MHLQVPQWVAIMHLVFLQITSTAWITRIGTIDMGNEHFEATHQDRQKSIVKENIRSRSLKGDIPQIAWSMHIVHLGTDISLSTSLWHMKRTCCSSTFLEWTDTSLQCSKKCASSRIAVYTKIFSITNCYNMLWVLTAQTNSSSIEGGSSLNNWQVSIAASELLEYPIFYLLTCTYCRHSKATVDTLGHERFDQDYSKHSEVCKRRLDASAHRIIFQ